MRGQLSSRGGRPCKPNLKLRIGTQRDEPARERLAATRKRVLRGARMTSTAKRRQRACRPCDGAPKGCCLREPTRFSSRKADTEAPKWPGVEELAGVEEQGMYALGSPGNLGDLIVSVREQSGRGPEPTPRPSTSTTRDVRGANTRVADGSAKRRKRSAARWAVRSRNASLYR